jgi:hypothetical protein
VIDGDDLVVLFTGTPIEAQLTRSLLEAVKIEVSSRMRSWEASLLGVPVPVRRAPQR